MKSHKSDFQTEQMQGMKNRIEIATKRLGMALTMVGLIIGLVLPIDTATLQASTQMTTRPITVPGWAQTGSLNGNHYLHTATLLLDGKVLVAGGGAGGYLAGNRAELYDPETRSWSFTDSLFEARALHHATLLSNGQVLIAGGANDVFGSIRLNSAELYDPESGSWRSTGSLTTIRVLSSITLLTTGKVLAVGRSVNNEVSAELYDPATGTWRPTGSPSFGGITIRLPNGKVLAVAGSFAEVYEPKTEQWRITNYPNQLQTPLTLTVLQNGKVLVTGYNAVSNSIAELYDPKTGLWNITGSLNYFHPDSYSATLLQDGRVLVAGGYATRYSPIGEEVYDPVTGTWSYTNRLLEARGYHTATLLQNGSVLVAGGVDDFYDIPNFLSSAEVIFNPRPLPVPKISIAAITRNGLVLQGENFDPGATIPLNGQEQKRSATTRIRKPS